MSKAALSRRGLITGMAAAVVGWNTATRSWATTADTTPLNAATVSAVPALDGTLVTAPATLAGYAGDFGHMVSAAPRAVLRPGSVQDIVKIVNYARCNGLKVAMNGRSGTGEDLESHSSYGQATAPGGISIDARSLNRILSVGAGSAVVEPGVTWAQLTEAALAQGRTPPCLTDYLHLSVGGTISIGGIGGTVQKYGLQADTVESIDIVTGTGQLVTACATRNRDLFQAALAGGGQVGIIVRATVKLVPAPQRAVVFNLFYDDLSVYLADQERLLADGRFGSQVGEVVRNASDSAWRYKIEAVAYYSGSAVPDRAALLRGLSPVAADTTVVDQSYREYTFRVDAFADALKEGGYWHEPKPWLSLFLPASTAGAFMREVVRELTPGDIGAGFLLFYPYASAKFTRPFAVIPEEPVGWLFDLLAFPAPGSDAAAMLERNRRLYDRAVALGAKRYLVGAVPRMTRGDWQRHFGTRWDALVAAKRTWDPARILTPGQGFFG
ncbi:FAD-binding protein [Kitasatospora sp. NPDC048239]|uniref:FAD-binding protein n=1 Tax=Kitasatospora sp. NPDC048239 TaxID=3364046 RepID=UPI003717AF49